MPRHVCFPDPTKYPLHCTHARSCAPTPAGPTNCPPGLCYDPATRTKFWGFTVAVLYADRLVTGKDNRLVILEDLGLRYR